MITHAVLNHLDKKPDEMSSEEKKAREDLITTLIAGAAAAAGGDAGSAVASSQVESENNGFSLPPGMSSYVQGAFSLATSMHNEGKSDAEINAALQEYVKGDHPEGQDPARGLLIAWAPVPSIAGSMVIAPASVAYGLIFGGLLGGSSDATQQYLTMKPGESYNYTDTLIAIGTGSLTQGKCVIFTTVVNSSGAYLGSALKNEDPTASTIGSIFGSVLGGMAANKVTSGLIDKGYGPVASGVAGDALGSIVGSSSGNTIKEITEDIKNEKK